MKFKHNKKRNTAFIYETLIVELSKASMASNEEKKEKLVFLFKEHFSKNTLLRRDLDIYRSFDGVSDMEEDLLNKIVQEAKEQFNSLDRKKIFSEQTSLINKINKTLGHTVWENFVTDYKKLATINQALNKSLDPKKQVLIEQKLINLLAHKGLDKKPFPNINNLAVKTFIQKFNQEYKDNLQESQKKLLEKYITSYKDDGIEFKMYLSQEIDRLKGDLREKIDKQPQPLSEKLQKVYERIDNYNERKLNKELISEVMQIQSLVEEIRQ
jgi:uncharacterized protein YicC (UPF0701 family)